jgi:hypothetical protein
MTRLTYQLARMAARMIASIQQPNETLRGTRVLMFHDLQKLTAFSDIYTMPASSFKGGMSLLSEWMKRKQTEFVPFSSEPRPGVAVTFDDGYRSTLYIAAEILISLQIPFHIFVTKSFVDSGGARYLSDSDLKRLVSMPGVTLGVHGVSHDRMPTLTESQLRTTHGDFDLNSFLSTRCLHDRGHFVGRGLRIYCSSVQQRRNVHLGTATNGDSAYRHVVTRYRTCMD